MSFPFHLISGVALSCALLYSSTSLWAKDYYKWVDANGSTHYTTTPPPKNAQKKGKIQTYGWNNSTPTASRNNNLPLEAQQNNSTMPADTATASKPVTNVNEDATRAPVSAAPAPSEIKAIPAPRPNGKKYPAE